VGVRARTEGVFEGVPMSSAGTCAAQRERFATLGLKVAELPPLRDVDRLEDARAVAAASPESRFAAALAAIARA
jgi:glycosyltransferase A (GT-A) superfamily protein (DUF2064 family)